MELIDHLDEKLWEKQDPKNAKGFKTYRIAKLTNMEAETFNYAIFDDLGDLRLVALEGGVAWGSHDPLWGIGNIQLKLNEEEKQIVGILVEDECVVRSNIKHNGQASDSSTENGQQQQHRVN